VIGMLEYRPQDLSDRARSVAADLPLHRHTQTDGPISSTYRRIPEAGSIDAQRGKREKTRAFDTRSIQFGRYDIELSAVEQLVDNGQLAAIADALLYLRQYLDKASVPEAIEQVMADIEAEGLDALQRQPAGDYAAFRPLELAAALNRLRSLRVKTEPH